MGLVSDQKISHENGPANSMGSPGGPSDRYESVVFYGRLGWTPIGLFFIFSVSWNYRCGRERYTGRNGWQCYKIGSPRQVSACLF